MKKIKELKNNQTLIAAFVVCIITFILLIMGATYAYFQATNNASGTTNLDATTEAIGNVVVTNPTENLYLKLSAYEMHEDQKGNSYYATSTNGDGVVYASERENNVFANYSIEGGTDNTTYNCTFKLNVTKPQDIRSGDMNLEISLLNGAKINGGSTLTTDLYNAASSYNVEFSVKGNGTGNLITGDIKLNNTTGVQDHLIGKTLSTRINVSDLECEVAEPKEESICTLASDSTVEAGLEGAKYNCKVEPNKDEYTFYLLDNNEDGTSDLIMNANINASGEAVIPGVTEDKGTVAWYADEAKNIHGPVTAMTYLHNATKSWTNVEPLNYTYNDREVQGDDTSGYQSFVSTNGIATITKGDTDGTQVTIGTTDEPLRARMPIYSSDINISEVGNKSSNSSNQFLFDNLDNLGRFSPYGYWTLSSYKLYGELRVHRISYNTIEIDGSNVNNSTYNGVRPVITVTL